MTRRAPSRCRVLLALGLLAPAGWAQAATPAAPVAEAVETAVRQWLDHKLGEAPAGTTVRVGPVDPRLRLPPCDAALAPYTLRPLRRMGRNTVGVRCPGSRPWKVYVPVEIRRTLPVLVARRPLSPGHTLRRDDLETVTRELDGAATGWVTQSQLNAAVGQTLLRPVAAGQVLRTEWLDQPAVVRRGQQVLLVAGGSTIRVRVEGTALADAGVGERVKVRNNRSQQVVEGTVTESGQIRVGF